MIFPGSCFPAAALSGKQRPSLQLLLMGTRSTVLLTPWCTSDREAAQSGSCFCPGQKQPVRDSTKLQLGIPMGDSSPPNVLLLSCPTALRCWTCFFPPPLALRHRGPGQQAGDSSGHGAGGVSVAPKFTSFKKQLPRALHFINLMVRIINLSVMTKKFPRNWSTQVSLKLHLFSK